MRLAFVHNQTSRELALRDALRAGITLNGDAFQAISQADPIDDIDCDVLAFVGVKSCEVCEYCSKTDRRFLYLDKAYYPSVEPFWRVAVDTTQPLEYVRTARHSLARWDTFGPRPKPWRKSGGHILIAGSSAKYHHFHGLPDPSVYAEQLVTELREFTDRPIRYRPKPSWRDARPIQGTEFAQNGKFEDVAHGAHAVITHGSNAALIAMLMGVPSIILGDGIMQPISSNRLSKIEDPYLAGDIERFQLLANVAWCQYTSSEFADGTAWASIKRLFLR